MTGSNLLSQAKEVGKLRKSWRKPMGTMEREFEREPEPDHRPRLITQELAREIAYAINDVLERRERHDLRFEIFIPGKNA